MTMSTTASLRFGAYVARCLTIGVVSTLIACSDGPTPPERRITPVVPSAAILPASTAAVVALQDAIDRSVATFDGANSVGLKQSLEAVVDALLRSDASGATAALDRAARLLDAFDRADQAGLDAELDVVRLARASAKGALVTRGP
jgi:hypothetical protein